MTQINSVGSRVHTPPPAEGQRLMINNSVAGIAAELGGTPEAYLAAIMMKFANDRGATAREQRAQIEKYISRVQADQVEQMHEQADELRTGALVGGVCGVVGGLLTIGAGCALAEGTKGAEAASKYFEGGGEVLDAAGGGVDGYYDGEAADDAADAEGSGNRADASIRRLETVQEDLEDARELEKKTLDFLDEVIETRTQTDQSVLIRG